MKTLSTILLGFAFAACAAEPPGGTGSGDPDDTTNNNTDDDDDPTGDPPAGGDATAAAVLERISKTECDQAFACQAEFPTEAGAFADYFGNSVAECYPLNAEYWNVATVEAGISAGTITFDAAAAAECLAGSIAAPACESFWNEGPGIPDACWESFAGTVAQGGACQIDLECSGELFCGQAGTCTADTGP